MGNAINAPIDTLSPMTPFAPHHTINPKEAAEIISTTG